MYSEKLTNQFCLKNLGYQFFVKEFFASSLRELYFREKKN